MRGLASGAAFVATVAASVGANAEESSVPVARSCPDQPVVATTIASRPAIITEDVWAHQWSWRVKILFRLDREGMPQVDDAEDAVLLRKGEASDAERAELTKIAAAAFAGYRFCRPVSANNYSRWAATLQFNPMPRYGAYQQVFTPTYSRDDVVNRRAGRVTVRGDYGIDGHATGAAIVSSSGVDALDQKAIGSMLDTVLVAQGGRPLPKPIAFERSFEFRLYAR